jgi:hypothetical protein
MSDHAIGNILAVGRRLAQKRGAAVNRSDDSTAIAISP